jgi:Zn-dependent M32 family carboxypeptidase
MAIAKARSGNDNNEDLQDQMLDEFEMGVSRDRIHDFFEQVRSALVPFH